jgi:two-component system, NarL family, response regulator EvgA
LAIERFIAAIFGFGFDPGNVSVKETAMTETVKVRAIIVDPHPLFCDAIRNCLTKGGYVVLSQAQDLDETMRQADSLHPDLVIVGPHLMEEGLVMCREMTRRWPSLRIIIFTAHADEPLFRADAAYAGVAACLRPESTDEELLAVIAKVMTGEQLFPHEILSLAFQPIKLTARELQVLRHGRGEIGSGNCRHAWSNNLNHSQPHPAHFGET